MILVIGGSFLVREAQVTSQSQSVKGVQANDYTVKEMLKTKEAYLLFIMFFYCMYERFISNRNCKRYRCKFS
ncbi:hypothetical protein GCM10020331_020410 [Ectobacillus funiculus]